MTGIESRIGDIFNPGFSESGFETGAERTKAFTEGTETEKVEGPKKFRLSLNNSSRAAIKSLASVPGVTDLSLLTENGVVSFAAIKEDMFKMFSLNISDKSIEVNYLLSLETVAFMFDGPEVVFEEQGEKLLLKCDTGDMSEFRQVIVPLRHDYSFELIREVNEFILSRKAKTLGELGFVRQLATLCKFQKTGVIVKDGWGMIDTPMFKVCRPIAYQGDLVITERALSQFVQFTRTEKEVHIGRVNRYTVCIDRYNFVFGFVRVRNTIPSFVESYKSRAPLAEYVVDTIALGKCISAIKQLKTQDVSISIDFKLGMTRIFERTKGEFIGYFFTKEVSRDPNVNIGAVEFNFKVLKSLMTSGLSFGICTVKIFKSIISFELSNGLIVMVKRGGS